MKRVFFLVYALICFLLFLGVSFYSMGFIGNFLTPTSLDAPQQTPLLLALAINVGLLGIFAVQHSLMARPAFKRWWTQFVPKPIERATYVLFSCAAMILVFACWQPMGVTIWKVEALPLQIGLYVMYGAGWALLFYSASLLNQFELFGLRQAWLEFRGKKYEPLPFNEPSLYKVVRHPLYVAWLMIFWFTPTMTVSHLVFAIGVTGYILVAIQLEERDLVNLLPGYAAYKKRVPMLIPRLWKSSEPKEAASQS